jgi:hypothetical protein
MSTDIGSFILFDKNNAFWNIPHILPRYNQFNMKRRLEFTVTHCCQVMFLPITFYLV